MRPEEDSTRVSLTLHNRSNPISRECANRMSLFVHRFDGDLLNSDKTAEDHELEGGEMIDMFISK